VPSHADGEWTAVFRSRVGGFPLQKWSLPTRWQAWVALARVQYLGMSMAFPERRCMAQVHEADHEDDDADRHEADNTEDPYPLPDPPSRIEAPLIDLSVPGTDSRLIVSRQRQPWGPDAPTIVWWELTSRRPIAAMHGEGGQAVLLVISVVDRWLNDGDLDRAPLS